MSNGNVMTDLGRNPLPNNHFLLRVDSVYDLPCKKVSGFEQEMEYETIQSGGVNDYVFLRPKPLSKHFTLKIERYVGEDYFDPLPVGKHLNLPIILYVGSYQNDFANPKLTFTFSGCTVMSKSYGDMDAETSGLMLETTTIAYQQMSMATGEK